MKKSQLMKCVKEKQYETRRSGQVFIKKIKKHVYKKDKFKQRAQTEVYEQERQKEQI